MATAPLLSVGLIFKNEERCLERCLKSLEPLRKAIPCEVVMADTGATDASREIAERYADEVFDFAWCDDFAAARNAVMDRCSGKWYMTIDCDEWLDEDISELVAFLKGRTKSDLAYVVVRNYHLAELEKSESYSDFRASRLVRMSTGQRYSGAIHESWICRGRLEHLRRTILHHDGYFYVDAEARKKKLARNMKLLEQRLEKQPEDLRTLLQCIESGGGTDLVPYIRRAVHIIQKKQGEWETYGGSILRHAVEIARVQELPELGEWIALAEAELPDSIFVQLDLQYSAFQAAYKAKEWEKAIRHGEDYRAGLRVLRAAHPPKRVEDEVTVGVFLFSEPPFERTLLIGLADAYCQTKQGETALRLLTELDGKTLNDSQVRNYIVALCQLHAQTMCDVGSVLSSFYGQISLEEPDKQKMQARLTALNAIAAACFTRKYQKKEKEHENYWRPAYTAFAALAGKCEAGRGAAILMTDDPAEMHDHLLAVEDWQSLPIEALEHALQAGVAFPLEEKPLPVEVLDGLAAKLTHGENMARQLALALADDAEYPGLQSLFWAEALGRAALQSFDWALGKNDAPVSKFACPEKKEETDQPPKCTAEEGLVLIRKFAQLEAALLPILYTPQALAEENAALLPPMHRWGLCCALALEQLDAGKPQEYLAALRRALKACPGQKEMVQFLLDRFKEDAAPKASSELLALAERVRTILAAYAPDDPAVAALKASPAYQQVAWLIEQGSVAQLLQ